MEFYSALIQRFGPQHWWPADSPAEVAIGAILTQNTNWSNVERAVERLRSQQLLDFEKILDTDEGRLGQIIRPAGYFNLKARRLKNLARFLSQFAGDSFHELNRLGLHRSRKQLLTVNGVGPETADTILLYACGLPSFVVDAYTMRVLRRHRLIDGGAKYDEVKALFEENLPHDVSLYNEYHALLVRLCKENCRRTASCTNCALSHHPHDELA